MLDCAQCDDQPAAFTTQQKLLVAQVRVIAPHGHCPIRGYRGWLDTVQVRLPPDLISMGSPAALLLESTK